MAIKSKEQQPKIDTLVDPESPATLENWTQPPYNQWGFRNVRCLMPTAEIRRGLGPIHTLPDNPQALDNIDFEGADGIRSTVRELLDKSFTDGFVVLHRGSVVYSEVSNSFEHDNQHIVFSVTKSVVGALAGIFIGQGLFCRKDKVVNIIAELSESGWADCTIGQVLDMTTAANFVEDYEDRNASVWAVRRILYRLPDASGRRAIQSVLDYLPSVGKNDRNGVLFTYKSADTLVLAWVIERTTGKGLAELIESELWSKLGAERDAYIMLDPKGVAYGAGGLCTTLRDLARFGLMIANGGALNGEQIVPEDWVVQCRTGNKEAFRQSTLADRFPKGAYNNHWWLKDADLGIQLALGIHGQMIYIDHRNELVGVKLSCWPAARLPETLADTVSAFDAIAKNL